MRPVVGALLCLVAVACSRPESSATRYQHWLDGGHREQASAYAAYLRARRVDQIVPMAELLRSGRRWQRCKVDEFAVPPRESWKSMTATLQLVDRLRTAGSLGHAKVASAWRSPAFNRCEGGSSQSRHLRNNALDFDIAGDNDVEALCAYWRKHGAERRFGLGFYSPRRIHLDTSGFRTWGSNHRRESSLCVREAGNRQ